jgi:hypothetical protein
MPALSHDDGTVIARELALATGALEVYAADTACVVGLFGQIPFPGGDSAEGVDGDFHLGVMLCGDLCKFSFLIASGDLCVMSLQVVCCVSSPTLSIFTRHACVYIVP